MALTGVAAFFVGNSETGISHESPVSQIKGIEFYVYLTIVLCVVPATFTI